MENMIQTVERISTDFAEGNEPFDNVTFPTIDNSHWWFNTREHMREEDLYEYPAYYEQ